MFLEEDKFYGFYMALVKEYGDVIGCNLNEQHLTKYDDVWYGYVSADFDKMDRFFFDNDYMISDFVSLYLKGLNLYPYWYGDSWRKYVLIESLDEIFRVASKTVNKNN